MKLVLFLISILATGTLHAQILEPVKWQTSVEKISESEYDLIATATIDEGWHLYSQNVPKGGPVATVFTFEGNSNYLKKGNTSEGSGHTVNDPIFEMKIKYFADKATFKQRVKALNKDKFEINGTVEFMVCDDRRCLPPTLNDISFTVN